jgi:hypothetical protein
MMRTRWPWMAGLSILIAIGFMVWANQQSTNRSFAMAEQFVVNDPANQDVNGALPSVTEPACPVTETPAIPELPPPATTPVVAPVALASDFVTLSPPPFTAPTLTIPNPPSDCDETPMAPPPPATVEPPMAPSIVKVSGPVPTPSAETSSPERVAFPWKFTMETVGDKTQFEVRRGEESLIRVQCDAVDFSSTGGGLVARGRVVVSGPCHEARCERMTIAWPSGEVALDGGVQLSFRHEGVQQMMRAEAVTFRIGGPTEPVEFSSRDVQIKVAPRGN